MNSARRPVTGWTLTSGRNGASGRRLRHVDVARRAGRWPRPYGRGHAEAGLGVVQRVEGRSRSTRCRVSSSSASYAARMSAHSVSPPADGTAPGRQHRRLRGDRAWNDESVCQPSLPARWRTSGSSGGSTLPSAVQFVKVRASRSTARRSAGRSDLFVVAEVLAREHEHRVLVERGFDLGPLGVGHRPQLDAGDDRPERRSRGLDADGAHGTLHHHGAITAVQNWARRSGSRSPSGRYGTARS